jgi:nucleoside-diphosphate-sugar epimerase
MSYALVTGGLGLIGASIARRLIEHDVVDEVVCLDHYGRYANSTRPEFVDFRRMRLEGIEDRVIIERGEAKYMSVMQDVLWKYRPVYIFHLAALPLAKLDNMNVEEARAGTLVSTSNILELLHKMSRHADYVPRRFVYASSSMVYGDFQSDEVREDDLTAPKELYGSMKLAGEVLTRGLGDFYRVPWTIIRPSAVYGPTDMNRRVSQIFIEKAFAGETIKVMGRDERLDFTYVKDVARGFVLAATQKAGAREVFNITYGKSHTLLQFVQCLQRHFPDLRYEITERDEFRPRRGTLSTEKARELLGYFAEYSLQRGIDEYVAFNKRRHPLFMSEAEPSAAVAGYELVRK